MYQSPSHEPAKQRRNTLIFSLPALLLVWFRQRTRSLLLPVLAHNVANGAFTLF